MHSTHTTSHNKIHCVGALQVTRRHNTPPLAASLAITPLPYVMIVSAYKFPLTPTIYPAVKVAFVFITRCLHEVTLAVSA